MAISRVPRYAFMLTGHGISLVTLSEVEHMRRAHAIVLAREDDIMQQDQVTLLSGPRRQPVKRKTN